MEITEKELRDIVRSELIKEGFFDFKDSPVLKAIGMVDDSGQPALPNKEEILDPGETGEPTVDNYILSDMTDLYMRLAEIIGNLFAGKTTMGTDEEGRPKAETAESAVLTHSKEKAQKNLARLDQMTAEFEGKMEALTDNEASMSQEQFDAATLDVENLEKEIEDLSKETEALPQNQGQLITKLIDKYFKKSFDLDNDGQIGDVDDLEMALSSMLDGEAFLDGSGLIGIIMREMNAIVTNHPNVVLEEYNRGQFDYEGKVYNVKYRACSPFINPNNFKEEVNQEASDTYGLSKDMINSFTSWADLNERVQKVNKDIGHVNFKRWGEFKSHLHNWFDSYMNSDDAKTFKLSIKDGNLIATYQVVLLLPTKFEDDNNFTWYTRNNTILGSRSKESNLSLIHSLCDMAKSDDLYAEELGIFGVKKTYTYKLDLPPAYGEFVEKNSEWAKYTKEIEAQMADVNAIAPNAPKIEIGKNYTEEEMQDIIDKVSTSDTSDIYEKLLKQYKQKYDEFIAQSKSTSAMEGLRYIRDQNKPLPFKWTEFGRNVTYDGMDGANLEELEIDEELAKKTTKLFCEYIESQNAAYLQPITDNPLITNKIAAERAATAKRKVEAEERRKRLEAQAAEAKRKAEAEAESRRQAEEQRKEIERQAAEERRKREEEEAEEERQRLLVIQQRRTANSAQRQKDLRDLGPDIVLFNDIKAFIPSIHDDGESLLRNNGMFVVGSSLGNIGKNYVPSAATELRRLMKGLRTMLRNFENNDKLMDVRKGDSSYWRQPNTPSYRQLEGKLNQIEEIYSDPRYRI